MTRIYFIVLLCLVAFVYGGCPTGTVYNSNTKLCYKYIKDMSSFVDAESTCMDLNGHLASSVHNAFTNSEIQSQANTFFSCTAQSDYWLGGETYVNSTWGWTDRTPWNYNNWSPGQPGTSPSPRCLSATVSDGRWFSSSCDVKKAFVCAVADATPTCPVCPTQGPTTACPKPAAPVAPCDDEWMHFSGTKYCYTVLHNATFWAAENRCKSLGAHLTSIHSFAENNFIQRITMTGLPTSSWTSYIWIGLNFQNGQWVWTDGTPFDYQRWYTGQPQTGYSIAKFISDYTNTALDGTWYANDLLTDSQRAFVCKKKAAY